MGREFITGAVLLVVGGLLVASAITGTTGSLFAVILSPGALQIRNNVAGTFRSAGGQNGGTTITPLSSATPAISSTPAAPASPAQLPSAGTF